MLKILNMKRVAFVIIVLLLSGCIGPQVNRDYISPPFVKDRADILYPAVYKCYGYTDTDAPPLFINNGFPPNAYYGFGEVIIDVNLFLEHDNDTMAFIIAHEFAHAKLNHVTKRLAVSYATSGIMMATGFIVPGLGYINYVINPAVTNNFSKTQEYDADRMASETLIKCLNIPVDKQIHILEIIKSGSGSGGGFWSSHPSWDDRIANIKKAP